MELKHPWTVGEMAKSLSLSPERFSSLYRETFGNSPISELIEARMLCAKRLLLQSDMPVKEIAVECGIQDIHYFSRIFKNVRNPSREFKGCHRDSKRA
jgi:transcriptional regulator GlxA family with amidase domain